MGTGNAEIVISLVGSQELEAMAKHRIKYLSELYRVISEDDTEKLKNDLVEYFKQSMKNGTFLAIKAELNREVIAYGAMIIKHIPGDFKQSTYKEAEILNMYTLPSFRRKGIGSRILEELVKIARSRSICKISLHTSKAAEDLYRNFGFREPEYPYLELNFADK